jgi:hypothetical protein
MVGQLVEEDLEGSSYGIFEILSWHLLGETEENHKKGSVRIASVPAEIQTTNLPNTSLMCYLSDTLLG